MALLLNCQDVSKAFGVRQLFQGISLGLSDEDHTGLIGPNGAGKSTFLKILAGMEHADSGEITTRRKLRLGYVEQEDVFDPAGTVEDILANAIDDDHIEHHERLVQANIMLGKVGFASPEQKAGELSGGWRKRLAIACQLIRQPDLLLMDEPTNHLDLEGIVWLEKLLATAPFSCLIVSHDRAFLQNSANRIIELSRAYPEGFLSVNGTYSDFLSVREDFLANQKSEQQSLQGRVKREIEWLHRGARARTTKAKGRIEQAHQMMANLEELKVRNSQQIAAEIDFSATQRQTRKLIELKSVAKSLGGKPLFKNLSLVLAPKMKLGLLGPNGSGKTTLLKLLTAELEPDAGQVIKAAELRVVAFDQNRGQLDKEQTLRKALWQHGDIVHYRESTMHITAWARRFLFRSEQLDLPVSELSGGEQARVLVAKLMLEPADVLILDEPTNDLDIPTLDVLEESLEDFPGAVVLVTHDRYLLDRLSTDLLALDDNGNANLYADLSQWEAAQERAKEATVEEKKSAAAPPPPSKPKPAGLKRLTWNEQKEWEQMEAKILAAESDVARWQAEAGNPAVMADHVKMTAACDALGKAQSEVERLYARWAELEGKQK